MPIDGVDLGPVLRDPAAPSPRSDLPYYARGRLEAVREGRYKRMYANPVRRPAVQPALYDLEGDPGETRDVSADLPEVVARLDALAEGYRQTLGDDLRDIVGSEVREVGRYPG